jgi:hypothetical protein
MKVHAELKRIEEEAKVSSHSGVNGNGNADVFELSLDELGYVAGGAIDAFLKLN